MPGFERLYDMNASVPLVSIVFATRNRKESLLCAIESCFAQEYTPLEVLVYDDASEDGTGKEVKRLFPSARYYRSDICCGQAGLRDRGFRDSQGKYVLSLDDDAYLTDSSTLDRIVAQFEGDDTISTIALPYYEFERDVPESMLQVAASLVEGQEMKSFTGCAVAFRKSHILECGGYRDYLIGQVEEKDLAIRLWDRNYRIVYGGGGPVVHMVSRIRDGERVHYQGVRNTLLFDCLNVPHPFVLPRLGIDSVQMFLYRLSFGNFFKRSWYVLKGLCSCIRHLPDRKPVSIAAYKKFRSLSSHSPEKRTGPIPEPLTGKNR